jgi:hypothetical protein
MQGPTVTRLGRDEEIAKQNEEEDGHISEEEVGDMWERGCRDYRGVLGANEKQEIALHREVRSVEMKSKVKALQSRR